MDRAGHAAVLRHAGAADHVDGDARASWAESSTERRSSRFIGTPPNSWPSMRRKQTLLSFCHGDIIATGRHGCCRRSSRCSATDCTASVLLTLLRRQPRAVRAC